MKKLVSVLAISLLLVMVTIVYAQGHGMMGEGSEMDFGLMGKGLGMMGDDPILNKLMSLGLDKKQKDAVKQLVITTIKETIKKRADLSIARIDLKDLLDKDSKNMTAVESKLNQIGSLETDIRLSYIKTLEAIKVQLTPDQRKKLNEMIEEGMMFEMKGGKMQGKGCGMMGEKKGEKMHHGDMETVSPPDEKNEEMPGMEHSH